LKTKKKKKGKNKKRNLFDKAKQGIKGLAAPFPCTPNPRPGSSASLRTKSALTKPITSGTIITPASLRSDGCSSTPGTPFGFRWNQRSPSPECAAVAHIGRMALIPNAPIAETVSSANRSDFASSGTAARPANLAAQETMDCERYAEAQRLFMDLTKSCPDWFDRDR
jgi:hypothetical protein